MKDMHLEIVEVPIDDLIPYENNANIHSEHQIAQIANSIQEFGFADPIGVWENAEGQIEIVEGHGRVLAAQKLGYDKVPVIFLNGLSDEQRRAYTHIHNQLTRNSEFDFDLLQEELNNLDFDWESFGFEDIEFDFTNEEPVEVEEVDVPDTVTCRAKRGDIWQLGNHRVMCGDSSDENDINILVGGGTPMMVFTDPPYGVAIGDKNKMLDECAQPSGRITENIIGDTLSAEELYEMLLKAFTNLKNVCSPECTYYVSSPQGGEIGLMMMMMKDAGLPVRHNLIWKKNTATFSMGRLDYDYQHEPIFYTWTKKHHFHGKNKTTILEYDKPRKCNLHPTMKPVELIAELVTNSSKPGDIVMDIFGGSGSTLIACEQLKRTCYMMELDPHYCDVIIQRWEEFTGETAVKVA